ncbi:AzlC family ABC transporter permease [Rhodovibrio salinarum]|uniref:Branched-chain amino acid ABC transporter permease n=1 Tax=Rhodovibrio salinarum TaxID=1087 RepID=A0A934QGN8_9PROT|nr:AzlC family ABC transporter permease [Rhodovibrio salinarum]MBK1696453.1 branched-chain amino acid ABC transporter permease [Rhodovibrio salinarum]
MSSSGQESAEPKRRPARERIGFGLAGMRYGAREMAVLAVTAVGPFAVAFGVAAQQGGMDALGAALMTGLVFAGASQFAALGLWQEPLPVFSILLATVAVNSRFLLMGAALRPWIAHLPGWKVYPSLFFLVDPVWAKSLKEFDDGMDDAGFIIGAGLVFWVVWTVFTMAGYALGGGIGDPARWGIDVLMPAFFAIILTGMWRGPGDALPWGVAAATALIAAQLLPGMWFVVLGGIAGGLTGALRDER